MQISLIRLLKCLTINSVALMMEVKFNMYIALYLAALCVVNLAEEISYLQVSSEQVKSGEFGLGGGNRTTSCKCGWSNKQASRIIGGKIAKPNEFPFAAALVDKSTNFLFCGAVLISPFHVLSGAHCTWRRRTEGDPISVVLGEHVLSKESNIRQLIDVRRIIEHQNFNRVTLLNDIAVLVLADKVNYNKFIGPICLPNARKNLDHKTVRIIGWGSTSKDGSMSSTLKKVNVRIVPIKTCSYNYPGSVSSLKQTQICTFARQKGSCQGDSGGPVIWSDPETKLYTLLGIVSFGKSCAASIPSVNTEVFAYNDWIQNTVEATSPGERTCY